MIAEEDQDFVWYKSSIHLPRMREMKEAKGQFAAEQGVPIRSVQNISRAGDGALEMPTNAIGSPDSIYFRRTEVIELLLGDDEILVKVEAAGVSSRDVDLVLGSIPWASLGLDGFGKVVNTGSAVPDLQQGDKFSPGTLRQRLRDIQENACLVCRESSDWRQ